VVGVDGDARPGRPAPVPYDRLDARTRAEDAPYLAALRAVLG
jgi:hypothetical protein